MVVEESFFDLTTPQQVFLVVQVVEVLVVLELMFLLQVVQELLVKVTLVVQVLNGLTQDTLLVVEVVLVPLGRLEYLDQKLVMAVLDYQAL